MRCVLLDVTMVGNISWLHKKTSTSIVSFLDADFLSVWQFSGYRHHNKISMFQNFYCNRMSFFISFNALKHFSLLISYSVCCKITASSTHFQKKIFLWKTVLTANLLQICRNITAGVYCGFRSNLCFRINAVNRNAIGRYVEHKRVVVGCSCNRLLLNITSVAQGT